MAIIRGFSLYRMIWLAGLLFLGICRSADGRTVAVGVYENEPKVFTDSSGKPAGIFIDLIEAIAAQEEWSLRYVHGSWGESLSRLETGELDLMPDVSHTTERETRFAFHKEPVLSDWFQIYARKGSGIKSIVDLAERRLMVLEHSVQEAAFRQMSENFGFSVTLIPLPDYGSIFKQVADHEADAAVVNRFYGLVHARSSGLEDTAIIFNPTKLFFAAPKGGREEILHAVDEHLRRMKKDPASAYYRTLERWTSDPVDFILPDWVRIIGLVAGTALFMSLWGSIVLKRQVNARTRELAGRNEQLQTMYGEIQRAEHSLRELNQDLERRVESRTVELAEAKERAESSDRLKSAFLATMSHELRTPLNSIIGFTGILLQGLAGPLNEEQKKQMGMVQLSSRHLLSLINDVLDLSKIEAGQLDLTRSCFDVRLSIQKTVELISPLAEKKGLQVQIEIAGGVDTAVADPRRIEQIILNLLSNAVKFTEKGLVRISCQVDDGWYSLAVSDTGIGIRPKDLPGLFRPFHQVDTGLSRRHEGTGLGLSICQKLIVMMGGTVSAESVPGEGSTFTIRFPKDAGGTV